MIKNNIFSREIQDIVKSLAGRIAGKNKDIQADLIQEGYLLLWEVSEYYDPQRGVPFEGFAYVVLRHKLPKVAKRIIQMISTEEENITDSLDELQGYEAACNVRDCSLTPCERFESEEARRVVREAAESLPYNERMVVIQCYGLDGLYERPYNAVAGEWGYSVEGVRKIHDRALKNLCVCFNGQKYGLCA